jgi:dimethylsulfone monooxygenase
MVVTPDASMSNRLAMYSANKLKLGLFGANCSSGRAVTMAAQCWSGSWQDNLTLARMAEDLGIEFMLPIGRWKGYGGDTDYQGTTLETLTWASGLLAKTERLVVFGTVHAPLIHPVIAAKQFVTADHIGEGRVGLNVVCGWNESEFEMFGVEHATTKSVTNTPRNGSTRLRQYGPALRSLISTASISGSGRFAPSQSHIAIRDRSIMNAGASAAGQSFAIATNCDALFIAPPKGDFGDWKRVVREVKNQAQQQGCQIAVYTVGVITCKPTRRAACQSTRRASMSPTSRN